ncbi:MAG: hypothetical protein OXE95_09615 [Chloroflexi bacterium]|nr:hypothetical protein [Chloroflexota bacterium]MCY4247815.1 hypothetical protein [Chloroflexota bacterium]
MTSTDSGAMDGLRLLGQIGKGVVKAVQLAGKGVGMTGQAINEGAVAVRTAMPVTEVTSVFNTTDETIRFVNQEKPRDSKEILPQSAVSMKTANAAGAWVPWFHPPRFAPFSKKRMEVVVDDLPVIYIWQRDDHIYWCNRLDSQGNPAKAYEVPGISHVGGKRMLVVRNDPENGYSAFLSESVENR